MSQLSEGQSLFFVTAIGVLAPVGVMANALVIAAILGKGKLRRAAMNALLMNMAAADLLFILVLCAAWLPMFYRRSWWWPLPPALCGLHNFLSCAMIFLSILTYMAIAIERYLVIVHPMRFTNALNPRRRQAFVSRNMLIVAGLWLVTALYELPNLLYTNRIYEFKHGNNTFYSCNSSPHTTAIVAYKWTEALLTYVMPITLSALLYTKICRVLWAANAMVFKREKIEISVVNRDRPSSTTTTTAEMQPTTTSPPRNISQQQAEALAARRNVVKMMIICVSVFFLCYTPAVVGFVGASIIPNALVLPVWFTPMVILLEVLCSSINPFLYTLFSATIRRRLAEMLATVGCVPKEWATDSQASGTSGGTTATTSSLGGGGGSRVMMRMPN